MRPQHCTGDGAAGIKSQVVCREAKSLLSPPLVAVSGHTPLAQVLTAGPSPAELVPAC